jgi:type II secretory pathway pseudopilin PulG
MTLVVSLIMLTLVTILVVAATFLSISNVRAVGNMQFRDEAVAAANVAIEDRVSAAFDTVPVTTTTPVDINDDGNADFSVDVTPTCLRANIASSAPPSSLSLPASMTASPTWNTLWDIDARSTDAATGAAVRVHSGVRVLLQDAEKSVSCP